LAAEVVEETSFGIISGQVTDTEKHTLPGATIQIESLHTGVTADINGFYKLPNIKPGTYTLKVSYVGYTPIYKKVSVTNSNKVIVTDIVMSEGLELQEVSVK
ncbi:carboxypeptidase-like regulatory domain-containing protein, partial [Parabacteroides distasonis]